MRSFSPKWLLAALASGRLNTAKLVTHTITPDKMNEAYDGLFKNKDEYLGVVVKWKYPACVKKNGEAFDQPRPEFWRIWLHHWDAPECVAEFARIRVSG